MRKFSYITVGTILNELKEEQAPITRVTFYRLEKRLNFPPGKKTSGKLQWRVYTRDEAEEIKSLIKGEYNLGQPSLTARLFNFRPQGFKKFLSSLPTPKKSSK